MKNIIEEKNQFGLLRAIPKDQLNEYLENQSMQIKVFSKTEVIHFEADPCIGVEIILEGQVVVEHIDESGYLMTITAFNPDEILGANLVFSKNPFYPMTVTCKTEATLLLIQKELLFTLCSTIPDFLMLFLAYISDHTLLLGHKIKHNVNRSIRESLLAFLKNEYHKQNTYSILLPMTKKALADQIGVQRTSLSRELQKMKNEGLISLGIHSIIILDPTLIK